VTTPACARTRGATVCSLLAPHVLHPHELAGQQLEGTRHTTIQAKALAFHLPLPFTNGHAWPPSPAEHRVAARSLLASATLTVRTLHAGAVALNTHMSSHPTPPAGCRSRLTPPVMEPPDAQALGQACSRRGPLLCSPPANRRSRPSGAQPTLASSSFGLEPLPSSGLNSSTRPT
jgi:hypothetical protein